MQHAAARVFELWARWLIAWRAPVWRGAAGPGRHAGQPDWALSAGKDDDS